MKRVSSLRWRLQVWHGVILFLAIAGFGVVLHASVRHSRMMEIDAELAAAARVLEGGLRGVPREFLEGRPQHFLWRFLLHGLLTLLGHRERQLAFENITPLLLVEPDPNRVPPGVGEGTAQASHSRERY